MGYTTTDKCHEDLNLEQTPKNVLNVLNRAGWTLQEASDGTKIHHARINAALYGSGKLTDSEWKILLDKAGRRVFDAS
jgi:hypothetical protein